MPDETTTELPEGYDPAKSYTPPRPELVNAIIHHESAGNPNAISPTGAVGLMQIEPSVAKDYGVDPETLKDPAVNRRLGSRYLADLTAKYGGDEHKALISYNQGPNRKGIVPSAAEYADKVLKTATPAATPAPMTVNDLPEGYDVNKAYDPAALTHGKPQPMIESSEQQRETMVRHARAQTIAQHEQEVAQFAGPIAASFVGGGLAEPLAASVGFDGAPAITRLAKAAVTAAGFAGGQEAGSAAVSGKVQDPIDIAKTVGLYTAFGLTGQLPELLLSTAAKSPTVMAALERARLAGAKVGPRTAAVADRVSEFFKTLAPNATPEELAGASSSAAKGNELRDKANAVLNAHRENIQSGLRDSLGDTATARVGREVVTDPMKDILEKKPYLNQQASPKMQGFLSKFGTAQPQAAAADAAEQGNTYLSKAANKQAGDRLLARLAGKAPPSDYTKNFQEGSNFYAQPDYSVDELTQVRSKLHTMVQSGNAADRAIDASVSQALDAEIKNQMVNGNRSPSDIASYEQFFREHWPEYKNVQDAMEMAGSGSSGLQQADKLWSIADDTSEKNGYQTFQKFVGWAKELQDADPKSNVMPALQEAYTLRLGKAYSLGTTPEVGRANVLKAVNDIPLDTRIAVFGRGSPLVDANRMANIIGKLDNTAEVEQLKANGSRLASAGRFGVSWYIQFRAAYALGKVAGFGGRGKSMSPWSAKADDLPLLGASIAAAFGGAMMFRAVSSYASVPVQKLYAYMIDHPGDPKSLETFARGLQVAIGTGQGAVAGAQSGHPYLGAAVGAALGAQGLPAREGTVEGAEVPKGAAPMPAAPPPADPVSLRPTGVDTPLTNRAQGFQRVGGPVTGTPPAAPTPQLPVSTPPKLPAVQEESPGDALQWMKQKAAPLPAVGRLRPPPLQDGTARPALPGGFAGPEGAGQFVTRPPAGGQVTPRPAPSIAPAAPEAAAAPSPEPEPANLFAADHPQAQLNTDIRKLRMNPKESWTLYSSKASDLGRNPERWQFKESNKEGLTDALSGVKHYDPLQSGDLMAYYDPATQKLEVIDGHQRHQLAADDNNAEVPYYVLDGGDQFKGAIASGVTPTTARAYASLRNLRAGTGSSLDVAKFIRDSGFTIEDLKGQNVPLSGLQMRQGFAMSNLDDNVFREVVDHRLPESTAIVLGTELPKNPVQTDILKQIHESEEKGKPVSPDLLREWIRQAKGSSGDQGSFDDLFGKKPSETNFKEMGQVSQFVRKELRTSKVAFKYTGKHADLLRTGNTIVDKETGMRMSQDAANRDMMFQRVGYERDSETHKIVDRAATELKGAKSRGQEQRILRDAYHAIQKALPTDFDRAIEATRTPAAS